MTLTQSERHILGVIGLFVAGLLVLALIGAAR